MYFNHPTCFKPEVLPENKTSAKSHKLTQAGPFL